MISPLKTWKAILFFLSICTLQYLVVIWAAEGAEAPPAKLRECLGEALRQRVAQQLPKQARLEIGDVTSLVPVPCGADVLLVSPNPPFGVVSFRASWLDHGEFRSTHGTALVEAYALVAVTRTALRPGDPLTTENVSFQERELTPYAQSGYFLDWASLQQVRARGFARAGMVLGSANTELPLPVHQGEMVELVRQHGALRLSAQVRALENGKLDQMIRVQNPSTNKILLARVTGPGELQLR